MKALIILLSVICPFVVIAQIVERQVIGTTGAKHFNTGSHQIAYTVGEPVIGSLSDSIVAITQGFHQTTVVDIGFPESIHFNDIIIYPNPVSSILSIRFENDIRKSDVWIEIIDLSGKELIRESLSTNNIVEKTIQYDLTDLPAAPYILRLVDVRAGAFYSFLFEKIE